jgi:hypothetical protein
MILRMFYRLTLYYDTMLYLGMSRVEEIAFKKYLQHVLEQLQYSFKVMGLYHVELHDVGRLSNHFHVAC